MTPKLPLTVEMDLWTAVANATSREFADSYLSGADQSLSKLLPRTVSAWERLTQNDYAMRAIRGLGLTLVKPPTFRGDESPYRRAA